MTGNRGKIAKNDASIKSSSTPCYWGARAVFGCQYRFLAVPSKMGLLSERIGKKV
jgi:hypothetical protein